MKPRRPTTRLWYVGLRGNEIWVSADRMGWWGGEEDRKIRACTAKAAGRRFQRNNVAAILAGRDLETDNIRSPTYMNLPAEEILPSDKQAARAMRVVVKKGDPNA